MKPFLLILSLVFTLPAFANSTGEQNRIISVGSSITELMYALDAKEQLVAIDVTSRHFDQSGSLPQVGYHRQLSAEGLMAQNPTHVIGSHEMGPDSTLKLLKSAGIEVITVPSGDSEADLAGRIDAIAKITGKEEQAKALKQDLHQQIETLSNLDSTHQPKAIFAMLSEGRPATVAGSETTIDKIIELAGATNPINGNFSSYKSMSFEAIVGVQPDYILVAQRTWDALGGQQGIIDKFPLLAATPAAADNKIIPIPSSAIIGGFGIESVELSQTLHQTFERN
ncbi:hemin ABC transporter substrate-binding protein [Vibrio breoganii]|uniref:heme/hemin ABC transporter substrate-binding protein n=1 Tax=Vibrio breoganii TaxID=553239 RepID=UPI000C838838|nr:ABC transporter substrate-binding protein [Vibrio breoganii]PMH18913.1 hemin receptor [Vibrio breoganii]PMM11828.1 hemin receptor [Vibrio breoganii]PMP04971.1 hemin receptor [Vibrio breoganii]TKF86937.1 hemin ABC transporter substrate-binding protein [Vibrio breoganii]TKG17497.1 hemin ABC transporter substrate-binding protein [Vibrio breoganii]